MSERVVKVARHVLGGQRMAIVTDIDERGRQVDVWSFRGLLADWRARRKARALRREEVEGPVIPTPTPAPRLREPEAETEEA